MSARLIGLVLVLVAFVAYTVEVVVVQGFGALIASHAVFGWESQVFLDLVLSIVAFNVLAVPDAKKRGIAYAPYLVATVLLGSIGVVAYFVRRELHALRSERAVGARA